MPPKIIVNIPPRILSNPVKAWKRQMAKDDGKAWGLWRYGDRRFDGEVIVFTLRYVPVLCALLPIPNIPRPQDTGTPITQGTKEVHETVSRAQETQPPSSTPSPATLHL